MDPRWWRHRLALAPDSGAGGGEEPGAGGADSAAGQDGADLFDLAGEEPEAKAEDGKPARPDWLPEQFWNAEKGEMRTDALAKSWRDLRGKVSQGVERPPEKPDAYVPPKVEGLPEGMIGGEGDTLWPSIQQAAHKAGISQKQLDALAAPFLGAVAQQLQEQGKAADPEAQAAAAEAEFDKLGPNGRALVRDVGGWMKGLQSQGMFTDEEVKALRGVSTAAGIRALAKLRELTGEKPIPTDAMQPDAMSLADAQRMMTEGYAKNDEGMVQKARRMLEDMERKGLLPAA